MSIDRVREFCLGLPHATESIQGENDLLLKVAGKMFAVLVLEPHDVWLSFKCSEEDFQELTERPGIIPAPYLARHHWVALQTRDALSQTELQHQLRRSYELVFEKLPKKTRAKLKMKTA